MENVENWECNHFQILDAATVMRETMQVYIVKKKKKQEKEGGSPDFSIILTTSIHLA